MKLPEWNTQVEELRQILLRAEKAHKESGNTGEHWAAFYAGFLLASGVKVEEFRTCHSETPTTPETEEDKREEVEGWLVQRPCS